MCAALSFSGRLLYAVSEDGSLFAFSTASGALEFESSGAKAMLRGGAAPGAVRVAGVAHHPFRSELASYGDDGVLRVWRP